MRGFFVGSEIEGGKEGGREGEGERESFDERRKKGSGVGEKKDWEKTH